MIPISSSSSSSSFLAFPCRHSETSAFVFAITWFARQRQLPRFARTTVGPLPSLQPWGPHLSRRSYCLFKFHCILCCLSVYLLLFLLYFVFFCDAMLCWWGRNSRFCARSENALDRWATPSAFLLYLSLPPSPTPPQKTNPGRASRLHKSGEIHCHWAPLPNSHFITFGFCIGFRKL